jgi:hypothetical protein
MSRQHLIQRLILLQKRISSYFSHRVFLHFHCDNYSQDIQSVLSQFIWEHLEDVKLRTNEEIVQGIPDCNRVHFDSMRKWTILLQKPKRKFSLISYEYRWNDSTFPWIELKEDEFSVRGIINVCEKHIGEVKTFAHLLCFEIAIKLEILE